MCGRGAQQRWRCGRARQQGSAAAYAQQQQGSAVGCGGTSGSSIMRRPPCDGTKHHSSSKACGCAAAGHSGGDRVMALHACHQRRHGCDSGGAVAAAWGARVIVCIGPVCDLGSGCPDGPRFFFNFSKLHFCFRHEARTGREGCARSNAERVRGVTTCVPPATLVPTNVAFRVVGAGSTFGHFRASSV